LKSRTTLVSIYSSLLTLRKRGNVDAGLSGDARLSGEGRREDEGDGGRRGGSEKGQGTGNSSETSSCGRQYTFGYFKVGPEQSMNTIVYHTAGTIILDPEYFRVWDLYRT
jgi:hypothetical protein